MASTLSPTLLHTLSLHRATCCKAQAPKPVPVSHKNRRQLLFSLTATTAVIGRELPSLAEDIPLFGLRKKLRSAEEEAVEIVREGFQTAEKGIETAERGIETVEKGIETAESEIEGAVSFGGLAQAGVVAGAEFVGVLIATSIVNGILGPEGQKS